MATSYKKGLIFIRNLRRKMPKIIQTNKLVCYIIRKYPTYCKIKKLLLNKILESGFIRNQTHFTQSNYADTSIQNKDYTCYTFIKRKYSSQKAVVL